MQNISYSKRKPDYRLLAAQEIERRAKLPVVNSFLDFVLYTKPTYETNWHHKYLCSKLDEFINGDITRLMVFMPPQHGKSELVSRRLPAYLLGKNPATKIIEASYSSDLSSSFNRDCQRIIDDPLYNDVFPKTYLNNSNVRTVAQGQWLRNSDIFETVGFGGYYNTVGVGGSLTGKTGDIGIIDDPIKDAMEAYSETYRNNIWEWYINVFKTRLHNNSRQLLTMTRWHEDDLAGRLLKAEPNKWAVVKLPALKEDNDNPDDPREIGEALWEDKHSRETIESFRTLNHRTFISLYQQRPSPEEGNIIKKHWFKTFQKSDLPNYVVKRFRSDTAYGREKSDPSNDICYSIYNENLYIWAVSWQILSFPEYKKHYIKWILLNGYDNSSECIFEPKATGISTVQDIQATTKWNIGTDENPNEIIMKLNVILDESPKDAKETRVQSASPTIESGRVYLLAGETWIEQFMDECAAFPNGKNDDAPDNLAGIINRHFKLEQSTVIHY